MTRALPAAIAWLALCTQVCAQTPLEPQSAAPTAQARLMLGPALLHAVQDVGAPKAATATGFGYAAQLTVGARLSEAFLLHMAVAYQRTDAAHVDVVGDTSVSGLFVGVGASYWVLPADVLLAASVGVTRSAIEGAPVRVDIELPQSDASEVGLGAQLELGKLWSIAPRFGLGAGLVLGWGTASNPVAGVDTHRHLLSALLALCVRLG